jgi:hypothetical protein
MPANAGLLSCPSAIIGRTAAEARGDPGDRIPRGISCNECVAHALYHFELHPYDILA